MKSLARSLLIAVALATLCACKAVPMDPNAGELIASEGVRKIFAEEDWDAIEADGERIRCERHRRVGTHMVQRVCMTVAEWEARKRGTERVVYDRLNQPCVPVRSIGPEFKPHDTGCGE